MTGRIELIGASKEIAGNQILNQLDLTIEAGEFLCLLGPSGCGKTTLLRSIAGISQLSEGRILLDGEDITHTPAERRDIGMVFQHLALFPHMTIEQNVGYGLRLRKVAKGEIAERTNEILESFDLPNLARRYPHELSGGQKQRVAIARALITRPAALLFDEPLGALDTKLRHRMIQELRDLHRELKTTFVFVTHDQGEAFSLGDRVALMRGGEFEQLSAPEQLYHQPRNEFVADFVGAANVITGVVLEDGNVKALGASLQVSGAPSAGSEVSIMIRPEDLFFHADGPFQGVIVDRTFGGAVSNYRVEIDTKVISISVASATEPMLLLGDTVRMSIDPARLRIVEHGGKVTR